MAKKNYSEVQKLEFSSIWKIVIIWGAVIVLLIILGFVGRIIYRNSKKPKDTPTPESAVTQMVPSSTKYYDVSGDKQAYRTGANFIIISYDGNYYRVNSDGTVTRVSSDGTYLGNANDEETRRALSTVNQIVKTDKQASIAMSGLNDKKEEEKKEVEEPVQELTTLEKIYQQAKIMGYTEDELNRRLYAINSSPEGMAFMAEKGGVSISELIKSVMKDDGTQTNKEENKGISVSVENVGYIQDGNTTTTDEDGTSALPTWLEQSMSQPSASLSALTDSLKALTSGGTATNWDQVNNTSDKLAWQNAAQSEGFSANRLTKYDLVAGTVVPITITTGVNTDLPGQIIGLVRQDVYDTLTGTQVLIPKGSRLLATYNNGVSFGQKSIQIAWNQLITPDGWQFLLPGFNGITPDGYSGVKGNVNNHFWAILGGAIFGSVIDWSAAYAKSASGEVLQGNPLTELLQTLFNVTVENTATVGQQYASMWANLQPTIKIKTGTQTQLLVNQTISLKRETTNNYK